MFQFGTFISELSLITDTNKIYCYPTNAILQNCYPTNEIVDAIS